MHYLASWQGALVLAAVPLLHWIFLGRTFAVSGRISALVDRLRGAAPDDAGPALDEAALLAAIRAETEAAFGAQAAEAQDTPPEQPSSAATLAFAPPRAAFSLASPETWLLHALFFAGVVVGGFLSALENGSFAPSATLRGELFARTLAPAPWVGPVVLFIGGALVGFGTRMAAGCTSGHGLCGVSQLQKGSLLATAAFFGSGVLASLALGALT